MTVELPQALKDAVRAVGHTPHLLLAMDFDGTMSPLVPRAQDARPLPASAAAFTALTALPRTTTALVSGRALASLRLVASPPPRALLVGSHGAELWLGPDSPDLGLTGPQRLSLQQAVSVMEKVASSYPGLTVELKPAGVVLHYRQATAEAAAAALIQARESLAVVSLTSESRASKSEECTLYITEGKMVLEVSVINANKGESLELLRHKSNATAVMFMGDDVTDEHGFAALQAGDLGIKVGSGATAARFHIDSTAQVPAVLELLLAVRRAALDELNIKK